MMSPGAESSDAQYRALGNATQDARANGIVMFRATTSAADARALLAKSGATLVAGPSDAGAWRVAIAPARRDAVLTRIDAACAEVVKIGMDDAAIRASAAEPNPISAGVGDLAVFESHVVSFVRHNDGIDAKRSLMIA